MIFMVRLFPRVTYLIGLGVLLALFNGCAQYTASERVDPIKIALAPLINESEMAQVIAPLSRNLRERLNHAAGWHLVSEDEAEVVLEVRLLSLRRNAIARDPEDTGRPLSYAEELQVALEWVSDWPPPWGDDPVIFISVDTLVYAHPSLLTAETAATGELADRLARKILATISWPDPNH